MSTIERSPAYTAYLLRCWLDGENWRYSLEKVGSSRRQGFATLDELVAFLVTISIAKNEGGSMHQARTWEAHADDDNWT